MQSINLNEIQSKVTNVYLLFLQKNDQCADGYKVLKSDINKAIFKTLKDMYIKPLEPLFKNPYFEKFSYDISTDGAIQYLYKSDLEDKVLFNVLEKNINNIDSVKPLEDFSKTLSHSYLYAFIFELDNEKTFTIVRKIYASNYLKNKGLFTHNDSKLNSVEKDLFVLDSKIDCIIYNDIIYITGKYNFENMFDYDIHYVQKATDVLSSIQQSAIVQNFSEFKTDCLDRSTITRKLADLCVNGSIGSFIKKIKTEPNLVKDTITKYRLSTSISNNQLIYTDVSSLSEIINLIAENYFENDITHNQYVAKGKNRHSTKKRRTNKTPRRKKNK